MTARFRAVLLSVAVLAIAPGAAQAAPPANDDFAAAQALAGDTPAAVPSTTQDATRQPGEPNHSDDGTGSQRSVWYRWTAQSTRTVAFDTCTTNYDTHLGVYTGSAVNALTAVGRNNNACPSGFGSRVAFNARAGVTYSIAVDGCCGAPSGTFTLAFSALGNDAFAQRVRLTGASASVISNTAGASLEGGEGGTGNGSVWYEWIAPASGDVTMDTCGASTTTGDTTLRVTTGNALGSQTEVAVNDDTAGCAVATSPSFGSRVEFAATQGTAYNVRVATFGGARRFRLRINAAASDDLSEAVRLLGRSPFATGTTFGTSYEFGEPAVTTGPAGGTTWYRWTAPLGEAVTIDTCRSAAPTMLRVLTGSNVGGLTEIAANDDGECGGGLSRVTFTPTAFTDYAIQVESQAAEGGPIGLNWSPQTTITDAPPATGADSTAQFHFSASDATPGDGLSFQCSLDGGAYKTCDGPETYRGLAAGPHVFAVRGVDGDGSVDPSPATTAFEVAAPQPPPGAAQGPAGPTGPQGPAGPSTPGGQAEPELFMVISSAKLASVAGKRLSVPYVSTGAADTVLEVRLGRKVIARVTGRAKPGRNAIAWNGKDGKKAAKPGRYTVSLTGVAPGKKSTDTVPLTLRKK
jgi:hypothetical protein